MLVELRTKSQITIPKDIIKSFGLSEGDKFELYEKDGVICLMPVVVYPKKYIDELNDEIKNLKNNIKDGKQVTFNNIDDMLKDLEK